MTGPAGWAQEGEQLIVQGAETDTFGVIAHVLTPGEPTASGRGMALFAAHGRLALAEPLPQRPGQELWAGAATCQVGVVRDDLLHGRSPQTGGLARAGSVSGFGWPRSGDTFGVSTARW